MTAALKERIISMKINDFGTMTIFTEDEKGRVWIYEGCTFTAEHRPEEEDNSCVTFTNFEEGVS